MHRSHKDALRPQAEAHATGDYSRATSAYLHRGDLNTTAVSRSLPMPCGSTRDSAANLPGYGPMTFSIVACDGESTGAAAATCNLGVGSFVPHVLPTGAVATQADTNPVLGQQGIALMSQPLSLCAASTLSVLRQQDKEIEKRQVHAVDSSGGVAGWTGKECVPWAGHVHERFGQQHSVSVAGNMLVGPTVIEAMVSAYKASYNVGESMTERLLRANLEAGELAGGDKRGRMSAAVKVCRSKSFPYVDLRVDHHPTPLVELRRLYLERLKPDVAEFIESRHRSKL